MSMTMTVQIEGDINNWLEPLTDATRCRTSILAAEAIRPDTHTNECQIAEIQAAIKEADAGNFASDQEVADLARRWGLMCAS